jgi:hypothetical protein
MASVPEGTTCYVTVVPRDKAKAAAAPTSGNYRIHDVDSGDEIVGTTGLTPSASMEIVCTGSTVNALLDADRKSERRRVTVDLQYGGGDDLNGEYTYTVKRLIDLP